MKRETEDQNTEKREKSRADRSRIRNITKEVEEGRQEESKQKTQVRRKSSHTSHAKEWSKEFEEDDHERKIKMRRAERIRRQKRARRMKMAALVILVVILIGIVLLLFSFGQASRNNRKGMNLYEQGEYEEALEKFDAALAKDKTNARYLINQGMAYTALGEYENALLSFDDAVSNTNQNKLLMLAKRGSGIVYLSTGYYSMAVDLFTEALSYGSESYGETEIDILYYLAEALNLSGDAAGAADCYTQIIEYQEDDADAYMLRGLAYQSVGDNEEAEADLKTALEMDTKNYKLYLALYEVLMAQDEEEEAEEILEEALELGGKTGEDYSNRGIIYMYQEDYENAAEAFNIALEKEYYNAYLGLAESLERQGDYEDAATQYENYLETDTTNATAYNQYGLCLMELGRYEEAAAAFETGLALNDRLVDKELMFNEAIVYEYLSDWDTAYEKMAAFVEKYPEDTAGQHEYTFLESMQE